MSAVAQIRGYAPSGCGKSLKRDHLVATRAPIRATLHKTRLNNRITPAAGRTPDCQTAEKTFSPAIAAAAILDFRSLTSGTVRGTLGSASRLHETRRPQDPRRHEQNFACARRNKCNQYGSSTRTIGDRSPKNNFDVGCFSWWHNGCDVAQW